MQYISVYLSSTFADMQPYRDAVLEAMRKDSYNPHIRPVNAETAVHTAMSVWDKIGKDVRESDYYFLLMGERYGFVLEDKEVNPDGVSYTEHEFNTACEYGKKIIVFWGADPALNDYMDRTPDQQVDLLKKQKLERLKERARALPNYGPQKPTFSDKNGLIVHVQDAMNWLIANSREPSTQGFLHLFCDRSKQVAIFNSRRLQGGGFRTFIVSGDDNDLGIDLIRRFCVRELYPMKPDIPITDLLLIDSSLEGNALLLLNTYLEKVKGYRANTDSLPAMLKAFEDGGPDQKVACCVDVKEEMLGLQELNFLSYFIKTCAEMAPAASGVSFYFFINITDRVSGGGIFSLFRSSGAKKGLTQKIAQLMPDPSYSYDTTRLGKISKEEIIKWMVQELGKGAGDANEDFDREFFNYKKGSYSMRDVYETLKAYSKKI